MGSRHFSLARDDDVIERLRQTYRHLRVTPDDDLVAELPSVARPIVMAMSPSDRRHALVTYGALRASGADDELALAGLLHDMGKPPGALLVHRVAAALSPWLAEQLGRIGREYAHHAARGADMARELGLSPRIVTVIARHHERPRDADDRMLRAAERADA
jgi:putative nucleotidyltransferase with HDIG domain